MKPAQWTTRARHLERSWMAESNPSAACCWRYPAPYAAEEAESERARRGRSVSRDPSDGRLTHHRSNPPAQHTKNFSNGTAGLSA